MYLYMWYCKYQVWHLRPYTVFSIRVDRARQDELLFLIQSLFSVDHPTWMSDSIVYLLWAPLVAEHREMEKIFQSNDDFVSPPWFQNIIYLTESAVLSFVTFLYYSVIYQQYLVHGILNFLQCSLMWPPYPCQSAHICILHQTRLLLVIQVK